MADRLLELLAQAEHAIERRNAGPQFRNVRSALRWYFAQREKWGSAKALDYSRDIVQTSPQCSPASEPARVAFAAIALAIKHADKTQGVQWIDAEHRIWSVVPSTCLFSHYGGGLSYSEIVRVQPLFLTRLKKLMARTHRAIRQRLETGDWLEAS